MGKAWTALNLARIALGHRRAGIGYVVRELSRCPSHLIPRLLRKYGAHVGPGVFFKEGILIDNAEHDLDAKGDLSNLSIGSNCYIGKGVFFDLPDQIEIQDGCAISAGARFITHSDCGERPMSTWYPRQRAKIVIGKGSWIGVNAVVLQGVTLGECCVVAAGSIVTHSCVGYRVIAGAPARVVKELGPAKESLDRPPSGDE